MRLLLSSLIDGNAYPFLLLFPPYSPSPHFGPLIAIEASLLFCFDFRLRSVFVIVLIHHRERQGRTGEHRRAAGRAGKEHSN